MIYETCLNCQAGEFAGTDRDIRALSTITEALGDCHHHHTVTCESCGAWWFDDIVIGGLGLPVPARRDTELCGCPDDGAARYSRGIVQAPMPEAECHCTAADVEKHTVPIRLRES